MRQFQLSMSHDARKYFNMFYDRSRFVVIVTLDTDPAVSLLDWAMEMGVSNLGNRNQEWQAGSKLTYILFSCFAFP